MGYENPGRLIWSLALSGLGTLINAAGNSGAWQVGNQNAMSPVDLRGVEDGWLNCFATGVAGTSPHLTVTMNAFDNVGNPWKVISLADVTAQALAGGQQASFGKHGGGATNYALLPAWGQVAWAVTGSGATFTGVQIELWGR